MRLTELLITVVPIILALRLVVADPEPEEIDPLITGFSNFVSWFRSHGGTIDDRVAIGYEPGTKIRGMVATAPIPAGTLLIHTPGSLILSSVGDQCDKIEETAKEMELGIQSKWHDYFEFDDSLGNRIPTQWDRKNGPGRAMTELQGLPPAGDTHRHVDWYQRSCKIGIEMNDLDWKALIMFLTRGADIGLIPMYDLLNHHNGLINTNLHADAEGGISILALADIPVAAPIYLTYARAGMESTVDVFNTYGFVEDYPQLWRWTDEKSIQLSQDDKDYAYQRYGMSDRTINDHHGDRLRVEPNTNHHEVLVISPTLAALLPTKQLVQTLGNDSRSLEYWQKRITAHHAYLRASHANALGNSATAILKGLPTTIDDDEIQIPREKELFEKAKRVGGVVVDKGDEIQAIEFRLAFKKALRLTMDVAETEIFLDDSEEL